MRVLVLSFYYPPDLAAGSFRARALVHALRGLGVRGLEIDVVTTTPNRYASHTPTATCVESDDTLHVRRIPVRTHKGGMLSQSLSFLDFLLGVRKIVSSGQHWDVVVATSSRLMTASLGAYVTTTTKAKLYLDIRDLFVETLSDILARHSALRIVIPFFTRLEAWTFRKADRLAVVSPGFLEDMKRFLPATKLRVFTNGIDDCFLTASRQQWVRPTDRPLEILYAGNIGEGQGLERILPEAARALEGLANFLVIGDGGRRAALTDRLDELGVSNVTIRPPVARHELLAHYQAADALFVHLNNHNAFRKVLPSKVFEYGALNKPILAGVAGQAAKFISEELPGSWVFAPCDAEALIRSVRELRDAPNQFDRSRFRERFAREHIMSEMARDIVDLGHGALSE